MTNRDPQGLALAPSVDPLVELMDWLASPDGGALRLDQSIDLARAIARGEVPHVCMIGPVTRQGWYCGDGENIVNASKGVITTDGGKIWTKIELAGPNDFAVFHGEWMEVDGKRIPMKEYFRDGNSGESK